MSMNRRQKFQVALAFLFGVLFIIWLFRPGWDYLKILSLVGNALGILSMVLSYLAGEINVRKMMGDYCIYCNGILFGLICDNNLFIKVTDAGKALLKEIVLRPPYEGAKDYFYISDVDDRDYLVALIKATLPALPAPKTKKK